MFSILADAMFTAARQSPVKRDNEFADRFTPKRPHRKPYDTSYWNPYSYFQ